MSDKNEKPKLTPEQRIALLRKIDKQLTSDSQFQANKRFVESICK